MSIINKVLFFFDLSDFNFLVFSQDLLYTHYARYNQQRYIFRLNREYRTTYICHVIVKLLPSISPLVKVVSNPSRTAPDRRSRLKGECHDVNIEFN